MTNTAVWDPFRGGRPTSVVPAGPAPTSPEPPAATFDHLYRTFAPAVLGYLTAQGVDDAEGVTHDVFLAVLPRVDSIRGGADGAKTLLFSIAHARVVDHWRRVSRTPALLEYDPDLDRRSIPSAEDTHVRASGANALALLGGLGEEQREVLLLRIVADLSLEQVAQIMGKSAGAIKQLQRRALAALKKQPMISGWRTR